MRPRLFLYLQLGFVKQTASKKLWKLQFVYLDDDSKKQKEFEIDFVDAEVNQTEITNEKHTVKHCVLTTDTRECRLC